MRIVVVIANHSFVHSFISLANISRRFRDFRFLLHMQKNTQIMYYVTEELTYKHYSCKGNTQANNLPNRESINTLKTYEITK